MSRKYRAAVAGAMFVALSFAFPSSADPLTDTPLDRYPPQEAGKEKTLTLFYGPFHIPPGHDLNRITLDLPVHTGFYTAIAPNLVDPVTGEEPGHQVAHIHHAHWFRITDDPNDERYNTGLEFMDWGTSWVFGTGEEKTQGSLADRAAVDPTGPRYGIYIKGDQPQLLIYMLHNKTAQPLNLYVVLNVKFVYGTAAQIEAKTGKQFHALKGKLWGTTFDVPREAGGDGIYKHPIDIPPGAPGYNVDFAANGKFFTAGFSGTIVAGAGHLHPAGREVVIANLGPAGSGCENDSDGDSYPGITILHSRKMEHVNADFYSEDYQMGATKLGFRAPIHQGDRIAQFGIYSNDLSASYGAMSYSGLYTDTAQVPSAATGCNQASYGSTLLPGDPLQGDPREGMLNHAWDGAPDQLCGLPSSPPPNNQSCNAVERDWDGTVRPNTVHITKFTYGPGDQTVSSPLRRLPQVNAGSSLRFVNDDAALGIRHSVTSCLWPCNGRYVANYPLPDATFDSAILGNIDPVDGSDFKIDWSTPASLVAGKYSYYCRVHPWMRGAFEVT